MGEEPRTVDELEHEPINQKTMVGEFPWEDMTEREVLNVLTELEKAKDTYNGSRAGVPYSLREKYREGSLRLNDFQ